MVFDSATKTPTRSNAANTDSATPKLGSLNLAAVNKTTALAGVDGVEGVLITGDRQQTLKGKETIDRTGAMHDYTTGDIDLKCTGTKNEEITDDSFILVDKSFSKTTMGETKETYTGETTRTYKSKKEEHEPVEWLHNVNEIFSYGKGHSDTFGLYSLTGGIGLTAFVGNMDLRGADIGLKGAVCEHHHTEFWMKEEKAEVILMAQRIRVTETFVMAVEPGVGATMLHEVAMTQEIFALGANQAF